MGIEESKEKTENNVLDDLEELSTKTTLVEDSISDETKKKLKNAIENTDPDNLSGHSISPDEVLSQLNEHSFAKNVEPCDIETVEGIVH